MEKTGLTLGKIDQLAERKEGNKLGKKKRKITIPSIEEFLVCPNCRKPICRKEAMQYMKNLCYCTGCGAYIEGYKQGKMK